MDGKDNKIESNNLINVKGKLLDLSIPRVMGIVNLNEDSFYSGARVQQEGELLRKVEQHLEEGATFIDVGGISTRPNADLFDDEEELRRVVPAIQKIKREFPEAIISVDTFRSSVAQNAVKEGASIVNDVYGGRFDDNMFDVVANLQVPYILMHSRGFASDMQRKTTYRNVVRDIMKELSISLNKLRGKQVKDVIIDPGFGFAKTIEQNYELVEKLDLLNELNCPLLVGVSRKSMIYKKLGVTAEGSLNGTTILNTAAFLRGAKIFRVHDVKPAREIIQLLS